MDLRKSSRREGSVIQPFNFASFVPVPENRAALLAVQQLAAEIGSQRRKRPLAPVYLHGPAGTGKTHLVSALIDDVTRRSPSLVITVFSAGDWASLAGPSAEETAERLSPLQGVRHSDLMVVEDLQYLPARAAEMFGRLFDDLRARRVSLLLTASCGPNSLDVPAWLRSRLAGGLIVGLEALSAPSRLVFLEAKARQRQLTVGREVLSWLAHHLTGGRQLEGALTRLETLGRMQPLPLDVAAVAGHFREEAEVGRPTVERIAQRVSGHFRVEPQELRSGRRGRDVLLPRQVGMYLARQLTGLSLEQIGAYFGGRDHSTVRHACRKVEQALASDQALCGTVRRLQADLA